MNVRENVAAILNYEKYDQMPLVYFGVWKETLQKWYAEGHISEDLLDWDDGTELDKKLAKVLGFDFNWFNCVSPANCKKAYTSLFPIFEECIIERRSDGSIIRFNVEGVKVMEKAGNTSIPFEIEHTLVDRTSWEKHYLPRLQYCDERIDAEELKTLAAEDDKREIPLGIYFVSMLGQIRNWLGVEGMSYLYADDFDLFAEIINTVGELNNKVAEKMLSFNVKFDFAHVWEDICFKNGPLIVPSVFDKLVGPHYRRMAEICEKHGIAIRSLDCDGVIDSLIPTWINNGINTMFPIEVGTWNGSILPWREKYGRKLRGVGGMNKVVFAYDYAAIDKEIERLRPLIELGGYIPCPDHRIAADAKFDNVLYYCERMRALYS